MGYISVLFTYLLTYLPTFVQNLTTLALAVSEISLGALKFTVGHVTLTTPLLRAVYPLYAWT